jgi:hypothetical protein
VHANNWQEIFQKLMLFRNNWRRSFSTHVKLLFRSAELASSCVKKKRKKRKNWPHSEVRTNRQDKVLKTLVTGGEDQIKRKSGF